MEFYVALTLSYHRVAMVFGMDYIWPAEEP